VCFSTLGRASDTFTVAERAADRVLALPIYGELTLAQQERVVTGLADFYARRP
jgi:dTDP-4-amino-4,6-dideoxygalactose transaminase